MLAVGVILLCVGILMLRRALRSKSGDALFYCGVSSMLFFALAIYVIVFSIR